MDYNNKKEWTIIDIIRWGEDYFRNKGIESPRLNIELLVCNILHIDRIDIYTKFDKPLNENELLSIRNVIKRRLKREPLQYIFGKADFFGAEFMLNPSVLIPRPETELLTDMAYRMISKYNFKSILDIGVGSGCIAVSLAKRFPNSIFTGLDISEKALAIAFENAQINCLNNLDFKKLNILSQKPQSKYDMIISNPPYISRQDYLQLEQDVLDFEPRSALTDELDGLTFFRRYAEIFCDILLPNGIFLLEIGVGQAKEVTELFSQNFDMEVTEDFSRIERFVVGRRKNR